MKCILCSFFLLKKVDPSKASTLEAAAKPEPPPAVQEEKKPASKSSFMSLFKPKVRTPSPTFLWVFRISYISVNSGDISQQKVTDSCEFEELLDHMTAKVQAASTSGVRLFRRTAGVVNTEKWPLEMRHH